MNASLRLLAAVATTLVFAVACQNEQSAVVPDKLASAAPSVAGSTTPAVAAGSTAPFGPLASGQGPIDLSDPNGASPGNKTAADPGTPGLNPHGVGKPPSASGSKGSAPAVQQAQPSVVKLIKAGAEPHEKLRFTPKVGDVSTTEMIMKTEIKMEIDGKKPPTGTVPPIVFLMETKIVDISDAGDIRYKYELKEAGVRAVPGVEAKAITALNKVLGSLVGMRGSVLVSNRGITKETKLSLPGKKNAQAAQVLQGMEQAMQQLGAPLPEEPVGKGAQWTHTTTVVQNGIHLNQVATYSLVKVSDDKITCKVALTQAGGKQKVASPVGITVDLLSLKSKGKGTTKIRLDRLTPIKSKMKINTKTKMALPQGQKMKMDSHLTLEVGKPGKQKKSKSKSKTTTSEPLAPPPAKPSPSPAPPPKAAPVKPPPAPLPKTGP